MNAPLILLVEDEEPMRKVASHYLARAGYRVVEAENGIDALEAGKTSCPDLVISDVLMPGMDGYELVRALRRDPRLAAVPVILFSGIFVEESALSLAKNLGIAEFLTKPFTRTTFLDSVSKALHGGNSAPSDSTEQLDRNHNRILVDKLAQKVGDLASSEARFRQLAENINSIFWLSDPANGKVHYISPAYATIWGRSCVSLYADPHSWAEMIHPEDRARAIQCGPMLPVTERAEQTYRIIRADGGIRWIQERAFPVRDESGRIVRVAGIAEDITERKRVELALDERLRFETLLTELSATFAKLPVTEVDREIDKWLKKLVEFLEIDRGTFFHLGEDQTIVYRTHSHTAPGIEPLPLTAMNKDFPWITDQLRRGNTIHWPRVPEDIPEEAKQEREHSIKVGVKSGLNIPVIIGDSVICAICFTSIRAYRNWPEEMIARLRLAGEIFANAMARKQAEMALRQSERQIRLFALATNDALWNWDFATNSVLRSVGFEEHFGYPPETIDPVLKWWADRVHPDDLTRISEAFHRALEAGEETCSYQYRFRKRDGTYATVVDRLYYLRDDFGKATGALGAMTDITAQVDHQAALLDISRRLMRAEDAERRRIAKELHDSTVQDLVAVMMNLESLRESAVQQNPLEAKNLEDSVALLENCAHEIRTLSYVLHPPRLDEAGLAGAIRHYGGGFAERTGIEMNLDLPPEMVRLGETVEMILFRVVQEALGNIHRHSGSRTAAVRLQHQDGQVILEVRDEGRGISQRILDGNPEQGTKLGVGISGMRERLRQIGGNLEIISGLKGTTVRAIAPSSEGVA